MGGRQNQLAARRWSQQRLNVVWPTLRGVKRVLRAPAVIISEIVAIALAGVLGASFPQAGTASIAELARLRDNPALVVTLIDFFSLDRIFQSGWFLALTIVASASLSIVVAEQLRRLRVMWLLNLTEAKFQKAPFRTEFDRPARLPSPGSEDERSIEIKTAGKLGLAGSPIFHSGILLVIVAGALRALFAVEAVVDLIEGETLPPTSEAWAAQWPGALAQPFRLEYPVTLDGVKATRYEAGDLRDLTVQLSVQQGKGIEKREVAVNRELHAPGGRLFLGSDFGPAAMMEWQKNGAEPIRHAALLTSRGKGVFESASFVEGLIRTHLRARVDSAGNHPTALEVRVVDVGSRALLFSGLVRVGEAVSLPGGEVLTLHGLPFWARLRGSRDPALWLAYVGFALALVGATIIFAIVKIDTCVAITPAGERERVFVALSAHRFAPLFHDRFQRLVREQGGPG